MTRPAEGRDYALLKQLFAIEIPTEAEISLHATDSQKAGMGEEGEPDAPTAMSPIPSIVKPLRLQARDAWRLSMWSDTWRKGPETDP